MNGFTNENDWEIFRKRLLGWQEAYMDKLNKEYIEILNSEHRHPNDFGNWKKEYKEINTALV